MSSPFWRAAALVAIVLATIYVCLQGNIGKPASYGDGVGPVAFTSTWFRLGVVSPGTSLARADLQTGQFVRWAHWDIPTRAAVTEPLPGSRVVLQTASGRSVTLIANAAPLQGLPAALVAVRLSFLLVAGFLVVRRWKERAVRSLALFLGGFGLALALPSSFPFVSSFFSFALFEIGGIALLIVAVAAAADFSARVTGAPRPVERTLSSLAWITATIAALCIVCASLLLPTALGPVTRSLLALVASLPFVLAVATVVAGYLEARGPDRVRKRWVLWIIGLGLTGPALDILVSAFFGYNAFLDQGTVVTAAIIPIGLAYVILRHRLIDVGFVLNQAAVFAGVSVVVVGVVVLVEYLLSRYVESVSHVTSTAVQLAVALALGFSINAIHVRVDRVVDQLFFRKRHEAEASLRGFALDAPYYTNPHVLLERAADAVLRYAQPLRAGIWMKGDRTATYELRVGDLPAVVIDVDDPAIVAMRARHVVVDLHTTRSALPGVVAFPMTGGGELIGALVCDSKRDEESYAPDERAALETLAQAVAHAWATLRTKELEREVERLRGPLQASSATEGAIGAV